jgi:hypothetical protein
MVVFMICLALAVAGCGERGAARPVRFRAPASIGLPVGEFPYPQPKVDRRVALIKEKLRQNGFQVVDAFFEPAKKGAPAMLGATVRADYAQPSYSKVLTQAFNIWDILYLSLGNDIGLAETDRWFFVAGQYWTKYVLYVYLSVHNARIFITKVSDLRRLARRGRSTSKEEAKALEQLLDTVQIRVFDVERRQLVDEKEFQNKHFADE